MTMTVKQMIARLQGLGHMVAQQAAARDDLDIHAKCIEANRAFLEILDGKTDHFPKAIINPAPHPDDIREAKRDGGAWLDADVVLHDNLAGRFSEMAANDDASWPDRTSGAHTQDEVTNMFLSSMCSAARYWGKLVHTQRTAGPKTDLDCCDGTIFSVFNLLDGSNIASPMFDVVPDADDIAARPAVADFQPVVLDGYMHETFYQTDAFKPARPAEVDGPGI